MNIRSSRSPVRFTLYVAFCFAAVAASRALAAPLATGEPVRGWTLLSRSEPDALRALAAARDYGINHVQLSHHLVHELVALKSEPQRALVNRLVVAAHANGVAEVVLWDHAFYRLEHYPRSFRTGPGGTLDLDCPEFWTWFKADYRAMLDRAPDADGIVLTFIETGARAERQHSATLSAAGKLAAVVNAVADVVIGERQQNLYVRTFSYSYSEYENILGAVRLFARPEVRLLMKETPHDFFLTHPEDPFIGRAARPTVVEFDAAGEYNGQGLIAGTWPDYFLERWRAVSGRPHVAGYTARVDRYGETGLVGRPGEINLLALKRAAENPGTTPEMIYEEFIARRYGAEALPHLKPVFKRARDIVQSTLYTLGLNIANHSALNYDPYVSSYGRHVSGRWMEPPTIRIAHGVDRELHYWRDIVQHLAPAFAKNPDGALWRDIPQGREQRWLESEERMTEEFLRYIVAEKNHGVALAEACARGIAAAQSALAPDDYGELTHYFARTLLTAQLHRGVASAYFGFRTWCRDGEHRSAFVHDTVQAGLAEIRAVAPRVRTYPAVPRGAQWRWAHDAEVAETYFRWIVEEGWPATARDAEAALRRLSGRDAEAATGSDRRNPQAGLKFPFVPTTRPRE